MLTLTVNQPQSLKEFTENNYAQASFVWAYLLKNKEIKVNGKKVGENLLLEKGDTVSYFLTAKQQERQAYRILYEDAQIIVVDKESGVNSEAVYAALLREQESYFIHRLDRNTQGVLVFAKTQIAADLLLDAFKEKRTRKIYHAVCVGRLASSSALLTAYLKKDENRSEVQVFDAPRAGADKIITEYRVLESKNALTKLEICLHTGKTHQIRAHFAHIGNPVLGDMKYGDKTVNKQFNRSRQCLVAKEFTLYIPELPQIDGKTFRSAFDVEIID